LLKSVFIFENARAPSPPVQYFRNASRRLARTIVRGALDGMKAATLSFD